MNWSSQSSSIGTPSTVAVPSLMADRADAPLAAQRTMAFVYGLSGGMPMTSGGSDGFDGFDGFGFSTRGNGSPRTSTAIVP